MSSDRTQTQDEASAHREASCPLGSGDVVAGRYAVELLVGEGTFGWVLAALDVAASPPRRVALKLLRPRYATQGDVLRRFERRELVVLRRIEATSPTVHVVRALEPAVLWHGALPYLVLEFIDGPSLREVLDRGPLALTDVLGLGAGLARGLASIHAAGGVHRDLKPTNVRLRAGREPVIVDLGLTRAFWETQEATAPGLAAMTPRYASPEQIAGREVGPESDVYSLGLILCELLTGEAPSPGQGPRELLASRREAFPRMLLEWVPRCLERDPPLRPTARELASALEQAAVLAAPAARPGRSRVPRWGAAAGTVMLLALGGVGASLFRKAAPVPAPLAEAALPWSVRWGDGVRKTILHLALDASGHVFIAGQLRGSVDVGTGPLTSLGSNDILVARFEPGGRALWARRFGDAGLQNVNGMATSPAGHVFVTGGFTETLDFGGQRLFNPGAQDVFLARLDSEGRPLWSRRFGDVSEQVADAVAVDPEGNAVIAGLFHGSVDFGGGALVSAGLADVFLARFSPGGQPLWSRRFGGAGEQNATGLAVDGEGHIALAGNFEGSIDLGGGSLSTSSPLASFVALFDSEGRPRWSRRLEEGPSIGTLVTFDTSGHLVTVEKYARTATWGFVITRFTPEGQPLWSRRIESTGPMDALRLAAAPGGRVVVVGWAQGELDLGDGVSSGEGGADVLVFELGPDGDVLGVRRFGDAAHQLGRSVAVDAGGHMLIAGSFAGNLDFGSGPLVSAGESDFFLARLAPASASPPPASRDGTCPPPPGDWVAWYPFEAPEPVAGPGTTPPGRLLGNGGSVPGPLRGALRLVGGGFFEVPDAGALDFGEGPLSLSAWVRTTGTGGTQVILDKRREPPDLDGVTGYHLYVERGRLALQLADGSGKGGCQFRRSVPCTNYRSGHFIADGAWHLVTVTVERGAGFGGTFYVDGVAVSRFDPSLRTGSLDNGQPLRIGGRSSSETGLFHGFIDEVALWKRALTAEEVARLYRAGRTGPCPAQSSPVPSRSP
jgi:outer membrane protein assembly factor BamB